MGVLINTKRIKEPFLKACVALWLGERGGKEIQVSVDGAEPDPDEFRRTLEEAGYTREPRKGSSVDWTGIYRNDQGIEITTISMPGLDIEATFPDGRRFLAEAKGEPTPKGFKAGTDLTALYTCLGQLIFCLQDPLPEERALCLPVTDRIVGYVHRMLENPMVINLGIDFVLVDHEGNIDHKKSNR